MNTWDDLDEILSMGAYHKKMPRLKKVVNAIEHITHHKPEDTSDRPLLIEGIPAS